MKFTAKSSYLKPYFLSWRVARYPWQQFFFDRSGNISVSPGSDQAQSLSDEELIPKNEGLGAQRHIFMAEKGLLENSRPLEQSLRVGCWNIDWSVEGAAYDSIIAGI